MEIYVDINLTLTHPLATFWIRKKTTGRHYRIVRVNRS